MSDDVLGAIEEQSGKALVPSDDNLGQLHELVLEQIALEQAVEDAADVLKTKKKELKDIQEDKLPSKMAELGFRHFTTEDGFNITVKDKIAASISAANKPAAHQWLRDQGFGDIIKNEVTAKFPKGKEQAALDVLQYLDEAGHTAVREEAVNAQTLKAFAREQLEKGITLPESISTYPYSSAVIKK